MALEKVIPSLLSLQRNTDNSYQNDDDKYIIMVIIMLSQADRHTKESEDDDYSHPKQDKYFEGRDSEFLPGETQLLNEVGS